MFECLQKMEVIIGNFGIMGADLLMGILISVSVS